MTNLSTRLAKQEDYNRGSNIRQILLPEGEEGSDPISFLQKNLPIWPPTLKSFGTTELERAHRIYTGVGGDGGGGVSRDGSGKARTLIFRLLW